MFRHLFKNINPPDLNYRQNGVFKRFDQTEFIKDIKEIKGIKDLNDTKGNKNSKNILKNKGYKD